MGKKQNESRDMIEIDVQKLLVLCLRRWWLIIVCGLLAAGAGFLVTKYCVTPTFRASVTIYVNNTRRGEYIDYVSGSNLSASKQLVSTYINIIESDAVLSEVAERSGLSMTPDQVRSVMSAEQVDDTELFKVYILHPEPEMAANIANAIAKVAPGKIEAFVEGSSTKVVDYAAVPKFPTSPDLVKNTLLSGGIGCLLAIMCLMAGTFRKPGIKDPGVEELLGRKPVKLDQGMLEQFLGGKTVVVTGGGGSIGSELCRQIAQCHPKKLIVLDIYENNAYAIQQELQHTYGTQLDLEVVIASIRDKERIYSVFERCRPEIVFHAAAHKHVPFMEKNPGEAIKNNIFGTYHVVRAAEKFGVEKFVMISTDKAVNPTNVMGASKRFCEMILQSRADSPTEFAAVRFGNVLDSNGSVVPLFRRQIEAGGPVTITDKRMIRYFMTIPEAAQLVLEAGAMAKQSQIFVLDMGEPVKILSLAENLIRMSGLEPYKDIEIEEIGLRPGEKLFEELLMSSERLIKTTNKKIFIEQQSEIVPDVIMEHLVCLDSAITDDVSAEELIRLMKRMVPTYHSPEDLNQKAYDREMAIF